MVMNMNDETIIKKLLSMELKMLTNEDKEVKILFKDFINCRNVIVSYDYNRDEYCIGNDEIYRYSTPVLKEIKITIPCNGYSLKIDT